MPLRVASTSDFFQWSAAVSLAPYEMQAQHGADAKPMLLKRLALEIHKYGTLHVLRKGIKANGCKFRLVYFRPSSGLNETAGYRKTRTGTKCFGSGFFGCFLGSSQLAWGAMKTTGNNNGEHRRIRLVAIRTDDGTQSRASIDELTVADYAEAMIRGDKFPPIVVFQSNNDLIMADGFHRVKAAKKARLTTIAAEVRQGTRKDALKYSLHSNHNHGLRRNNEDKRHAVTIALKEFSHLSDRVVASMCAVSQPFVGVVRRELKTVISSDTRVGKDGKVRRMPIKPLAAGNGETMLVAVQDIGDEQLNAVILQISQSLAGIETAIRTVVSDYPDKKAAIRGFVAKARSDLAELEKKIASGK
jgi:hypothetical protein